MCSSCFVTPSNPKRSLCALFVTPLPPFSLQPTVTTETHCGQNSTCQPQILNRRFTFDRRHTSFIRYLGKNRQGADEASHEAGGFSAAGDRHNSTFSNGKDKSSKTRRIQPPSMLSSNPGPKKTRRASSSLPSNATTKKIEFPDLDHWPWSYEIDNPMMMERDKKDRKYPPGKLPFALELDFVLNHPVADAIIALLVSLNCLIFALQTIDVAPALHDAFFAYEKNLSILFVMEYFGRWYGKGLSPRYLFSRGMLVDFIAVAPYGFAAVSDQTEALFVRIVRLSRILRIQRVVMDTDRSAEMMESLSNLQVRLASVGLSLFSLLYVSAGLFYQAEKDVNPNVLNFFDAFYYSTITLFTVGFGDVTALTSWGRTITVLTVLSGAVLVPYQLSEIERVRELSQKTDAKREFEMIQQQTIASANKGTSLEGGDGPSDIDSSSVFIAVNDANIECKRCFLKGHQRDARFCRNCGALISKRRFD